MLVYRADSVLLLSARMARAHTGGEMRMPQGSDRRRPRCLLFVSPSSRVVCPPAHHQLKRLYIQPTSAGDCLSIDGNSNSQSVACAEVKPPPARLMLLSVLTAGSSPTSRQTNQGTTSRAKRPLSPMDLSMCSGGESDSDDAPTKDSDYESSDASENEEDDENKSDLTSDESRSGAEEKLQKVIKLSRFVPYSGPLEEARLRLWANLKANLCTALVSQGQVLEEWIFACNQYLTAFGFAITKTDHIMLVKLCWHSVTVNDYDYPNLHKMINLLVRLLKLPSLIHRDELQLDWRQLNSLIDRINHTPHARKQTIYFDPSVYTSLTALASAAMFYFTKESTREMLAEWSDYICIYSNKYSRYLYLFMLFLPTHLPPEEHQFGFKLWFEDFFKLWTALPAQDTSHQFNYFMYLFSTLAKSAFGYIDWAPHIPMILQRVKKCFNCKTATDLEVSMCSSWFVYIISPTNDFLAQLKQYFTFRFVHHKKIICYMLNKFILRLKIERRKVKYWYDYTPDSHRLTEEIICDFSTWMVTQFEKIAFADFEFEHLYNLSLICSKEMSNRVWEKLSLGEQKVEEPDRLKNALQLFAVSLYPMVTDEKLGPSHRTHVIPALMKLLQSINTNDHTLCFLHLFSIRSIIIMGIPLEDCSHLIKTNDTLTEEEATILRDSALLEDFPMQFLELCFTIIECNNDDLFRISEKGIMVKNIIFEILVHIFTVVSEEKFKILSHKLITFATTRLFENTDCTKIIDKMVLATLLFDKSGHSFEHFFTAVSANIKSSIDNESKFSDICKVEFIYNWRLLHTCFSFDGHLLLKYRTEIVQLLKQIYQIDFEDNFKHNALITDMLSFLFYILTSIYLIGYSFEHKPEKPLEEGGDDGRHLFDRLMKFPFTCKLKDLPIKWHEPCDDEINFAKELFQEFIKPEMVALDAWADSTRELATSQVEKSFGIILSFLGCIHCLPCIPDEMSPEMKYFNSPDIFAIDLFDGENFRDNLINLMAKVIAKLKSSTADNVALFMLIIEVLDYSLFSYKAINSSKSVSHSIYRNLVKEKASLPIVLYYYIISYQMALSGILKRWTNLQYTSSHNKAMHLLLDLSTCGFSKIRSQAQGILIDVWESFPETFQPFLPALLENLTKVETDYDAFKGTLYLLYGTNKFSIALNNDWSCLLQVWPALVSVNNAEKPNVAHLFDAWFYPLFNDHYITIPIERRLVGSTFADLFAKSSSEGWTVPKEGEISQIEAQIAEANLNNRSLYRQLISRLLETLNSKLHWRFYLLGCSLLDLLIRSDSPYPLEAVEFFLKNLVHDSVKIRHTATVAFKKVLFLKKPTKEITYAPSDAVDTSDLSFDCLDNRVRFESLVFHDKVHDGYRDGVPKIRTKLVDQNVDDLMFIREAFRDEAFLDQLFHLHSIEPEKENAKLSINSVKLWKHLTHIFRLFNTDLIFPRVRALLAKKKHNYDKFALEVLTGLVKASTHLDYEQLAQLKAFLVPILDSLPSSFNKESYSNWYSLFQAFFNQRDFRRHSWAFEHFFGNASLFANTWGPYHQASFMYFIATSQPANWRYSCLSQKVVCQLEQHLSHKYSYIRHSISYMLANVFQHRVGIGVGECNCTPIDPNCSDFIERIYRQLHDAISTLAVSMDDESAANMATVKSALFDSDTPVGQEMHNLLDTICHWVSDCLKSKNFVNVFDFAKFFPLLALIQTTNESLQKQAKNAIAYIAVQVYRAEDIDTLLGYISTVATNWNWHTRLIASTFTHTLVFNNRFILLTNTVWVDTLVDLISSQLLQDEIIEVRESSRQTLRDFIKWEFIQPDVRHRLIDDCKAKSLQLTANEPVELIRRHSGILGLCAFIYAFASTELPDFLPDVVLFLARRVSDPQPIQKTVTTALRFFKKTHEPFWIEHKLKFTEEQLTELANVLISSSCFA